MEIPPPLRWQPRRGQIITSVQNVTNFQQIWGKLLPHFYLLPSVPHIILLKLTLLVQSRIVKVVFPRSIFETVTREGESDIQADLNNKEKRVNVQERSHMVLWRVWAWWEPYVTASTGRGSSISRTTTFSMKGFISETWLHVSDASVLASLHASASSALKTRGSGAASSIWVRRQMVWSRQIRVRHAGCENPIQYLEGGSNCKKKKEKKAKRSNVLWECYHARIFAAGSKETAGSKMENVLRFSLWFQTWQSPTKRWEKGGREGGGARQAHMPSHRNVTKRFL